MSNFWSRALSSPVPRAVPAPAVPATPPQQAWWNSGQQPAQQQLGIPQGLAVGAYEQATDQAGLVAAQQGFIRKPPEWVQKQPTDHCPECGGVNFARHGQGEGTYGKLRKTTVGDVEFGRCFECGFTLNGGRGMSESQVGNAHSHGGLSAGGAVQATRQPHGLQNFYTIQ